MRITVDMKGDKEFRAYLLQAQRQLASLDPLYKVWGVTALKWIQENYRQSGAKTGRWKPLKPSTVQSRRKKSNKPLLDTGDLLRKWSWRIIPKGMVVGNPSNIAKYHETGTGPYEIRPKRRKFLWFGVQPSARWTGQQAGGHTNWYVQSKAFEGRLNKWAMSGTPGVFAKVVHHPGLPQRRQLPKEGEIMPEIRRVSIGWLKKKLRLT